MERRFRVIQWATGRTGERSMRAVIDHPWMQLVGLWVHSESKVGKDAGDLCGRPSTGIIATNCIDKIVSLDADCVLYLPQGLDVDAVCRILASGKNVVSSRFEFLHPPSMDPGIRSRIEAACAVGGTSIYGTGSSPGFVTEALPLVLMSIQRRLDCLTIDEFADMRQVRSTEMVFTHMGFGKPITDFDPNTLGEPKIGFAQSLRLVGMAIGLPLEKITTQIEVAGPQKEIDIHGRRLHKGAVAAQRTTLSGWHDGKVILRFRANWYCSKDIEPDWQLNDVGWRIRLDGDAPLDISITNPVSPDFLSDVAPNKTPFRIVNAIPYVCSAVPGIRTTLDLPQIIPHLGK